MLGSVQLLESARAAAESTRGGGGLSLEEAGFFSFPPENLLTMVAPWFFGNDATGQGPFDFLYWGRALFWETSFFLGTCTLILLLIGITRGRGSSRRIVLSLGALFVLLMFGSHTPFFSLLFEFLPGFSHFRGHGKFDFVATIYLAHLAALGLDAWSREPPRFSRWTLVAAGMGLATLAAAVVVRTTAGGPAGGMIGALGRYIAESGESFIAGDVYANPQFVSQAAAQAANSLIFGGLFLLAAASVSLLRRRRHRAVELLAWLAILELFVFARMTRQSFDMRTVLEPAYLDQVQVSLEEHERIWLQDGDVNGPMSSGLNNIWGYDPHNNRRYLELMRMLHESRPGVSEGLLRMLRTRLVLTPDAGGTYSIREVLDPLERFQLVSDFRIVRDLEKRASILTRRNFDPRETVLVEVRPAPEPQPGSAGDTLTVLADDGIDARLSISLQSPKLLLVTDTYSDGWRIRGEGNASQDEYAIQPANHALIAVALEAGSHELELAYAPAAFRLGVWISSTSLVAWLVAAGLLFRRAGAFEVAPR
jgi:hypothetical protein